MAGTVLAFEALEGRTQWAAFAFGLAAVAGIFTWLFHPRRMGRR
jgi:hypothetical protein